MGDTVEFIAGNDSAEDEGSSIFVKLKELKELRALKAEVEACLAAYPEAIRVREGGCLENLGASLAVTFASLKYNKCRCK